MKDLLALIKLILTVTTVENGVLKVNVDLNVTGLVNIKDPDGNWIIFVDRPVDTTTPAV